MHSSAHSNCVKQQTLEMDAIIKSVLSNELDADTLESIMQDSLLVHDLETGREDGVCNRDGLFLEMHSSLTGYSIVISDVNTKEMRVYENNKLSTAQISMSIIDLDSSGRRWEGSVSAGHPFGYGVIYSEEGRKEYEGFMINNRRVCFGTYYFDNETVNYSGAYCDDKKWGEGILFDKNGDIEYQGVWKNDKPLSLVFDGKSVDPFTESVRIPDHSFHSVACFTLPSWLISLNRIEIGNGCFEAVRDFSVDGLIALESVVIGKDCFAFTKNWSEVRESNRTDGSCRIVNCPHLKSIQIGDYSFSDYHTLIIGTLPSLQSIDIGEMCFYRTACFSLTSVITNLVCPSRFAQTRICHTER